MNRLSLLIPGLLGPLPELNDSPLKAPACPSLQRWLAKGEMQLTGYADYFQQLATLLGLPANSALARVAARVDRLFGQPAKLAEGQLLRARLSAAGPRRRRQQRIRSAKLRSSRRWP